MVPINDCLLIELTEDMIATPDKAYDTKTSGIVRVVCNEDHEYLLNHRVFFDEFKDTRVGYDNKTYTFIKYEDIRGYEQTFQAGN
jgi:co-chaperonin GroES (HSP10)